MKERHNRVSSHYQINVKLQDGKATGMTWEKLPPKKSKEDKANSIYSIWTSYTNLSEEELWQVFNTIRKSECQSIGLPKHRTAEADSLIQSREAASASSSYDCTAVTRNQVAVCLATWVRSAWASS